MPEHVHLVMATDEPMPMRRVLAQLKGGCALVVLKRWRELNAPVLDRITDANGRSHFWQTGGGYDRTVYPDGELVEKIDYIHMNPVRRGLVARPGEYRWSSLGWTRAAGGDVAPEHGS